MTTSTLSIPSRTNLFPWRGSRQHHHRIPFSPCISSAGTRIRARSAALVSSDPQTTLGRLSSVTVSLHQSEVQVLLPRPSVELLKLLLSTGHFPPQRIPTFTISPHNECSKKLACSKNLTMKPPSISAAHLSKQLGDSATVASSLRSFDSGSRFSRWLPAGYRIQSDGGTVAA